MIPLIFLGVHRVVLDKTRISLFRGLVFLEYILGPLRINIINLMSTIIKYETALTLLIYKVVTKLVRVIG